MRLVPSLVRTCVETNSSKGRRSAPAFRAHRIPVACSVARMKAPPVLRPDRLPLLPAAGALASGWLSLTPSLLPRDAALQGLLAAIAALLGYGLFAAIGWVLHAVGVRVAETRMMLLRRLLQKQKQRSHKLRRLSLNGRRICRRH